MPINIPKDLPINQILKEITIKNKKEINIAILNLMPEKIITENQLLSKLHNTPIIVNIDLIAIENHTHKNTDPLHLKKFYHTFSNIKNKHYDAMIITGAPVEHLEFEEISYWPELVTIMGWTKTNVKTTLFICWAAQAALYNFYEITKHSFSNKLFGVFKHDILLNDNIFTGLNPQFYTPHSRNSESDQKAIKDNKHLDVLAQSNDTGIHIIANKDRSQLYFTGHFEYDLDTLEKEYNRDLSKGWDTTLMPKNYYYNDQQNQGIIGQWFSDASLIFNNWLNYYVLKD